ncbi:hypothetical protein [Paenibacillus methanolicus]|uniref:Uncharacterized protein n=1 Tax=Paenibacillus methanolicus TaxID=582686 RepID=A0A5S5C9J3_9BACL|nr:hypothetical protein [Paenibacillus methanolicus]TYP74653.1 hypothetical protein BCM02_105197 [Paenibacillus methanolicus]
MPIVHAVVQEPYYEQPPWLPKVEYKEVVTLSALSNQADASLFLALLCGYNHIDVNREPDEVVRDLIALEEIAIRGGIAFEDERNRIVPSCCSGLETWRDILDAVLGKKGAWLGHDPFPTLTYESEFVNVWSDDVTGTMREVTESGRLKMYAITYRRDELIDKLQRIEQDLLDFYRHSLDKALAIVDDDLREALFSSYRRWFRLNAESS